MKEMHENQEKGSLGNIIEELQAVAAVPARDYKDRVFRMLFKEKEKALELYNAMNGTEYSDVNELELKTLVLNINQGYNEELKKRSLTLYEYMIFVDTVRTYAKSMPFPEAMKEAIDECIQ